MPRTVGQLIGIAARVSKAGGSTVVDYTGTVRIHGAGVWRTDRDVKFVLTPAATAATTALLAASIGRRLELAGRFQQDDPPSTTVRAGDVTNVIVG